MNSWLDLKRLYQLQKVDLSYFKKTLLYCAALFVIVILLAHNTSTHDYFLMLYWGGVILTARFWSGRQEGGAAFHYWNLPVSNFERFLSAWLLTGPLFIIATTLLCYVSMIAQQLITPYGLVSHVDLFSVVDPHFINGIRDYLLIQAIVLLGAISFNSNVLLKTALSLIALGIIIFVLPLMITLHWFFPTPINNVLLIHFIDHMSIVLKYVVFLVIPIFCCYLTYLKLQEKEL